MSRVTGFCFPSKQFKTLKHVSDCLQSMSVIYNMLLLHSNKPGSLPTFHPHRFLHISGTDYIILFEDVTIYVSPHNELSPPKGRQVADIIWYKILAKSFLYLYQRALLT